MKLRRTILALLCGALLVSGFFILSDVLNQLRDDIITQHEEKLTEVVHSVDISAQNRIHIYRESLIFVAERRGFRNAEQLWLETGDESEVLQRMQENLLMQGLKVENFLATNAAGICLSATGQTNYRFPETDEDLFLCMDDAGEWFLGIRHRISQVDYIALIRLVSLCKDLAESSAVSNTDRLLLVDRDGQTIISFWNDEAAVIPLTEAAVQDSPARRLAVQANNTDRKQVNIMEVEEDDGTRTMGYGLIGSGGSRNGFFTICVLDTYDSHLKNLRENTIRMIIGCLTLLAGLLLVVHDMGNLNRENRRNAKELQRLKQREETLEKINRQTRELAHHQRLETIGTLTSSISHEFNNLLTPIMSCSLLTLEKLPAEEEELYDNVLEIYTASQKAKRIISRLSDLSRKNSPRTFRETSVDTLVKKALDIALPAKPEGVEVKMNLNCLDSSLCANEIQITQMMLNLILNAFHAMEGGGILELSTVAQDQRIQICVKDTGCGIPETIREKIFDPFFTTKESGKGTGLGLAIVAQVLEDHRGTIEVTSEPGQGTEFRIWIPCNPEPCQYPAIQHQQS